MTPSLQKLAALGAYAVSVGLVGLFAFLAWLMWPDRAAGMNRTMLAVGILCVAIPIGLVIAIHIALARQLTRRDY
jgi:TRAP-type C4-dicarboxylate transport system permease small subunit